MNVNKIEKYQNYSKIRAICNEQKPITTFSIVQKCTNLSHFLYHKNLKLSFLSIFELKTVFVNFIQEQFFIEDLLH